MLVEPATDFEDTEVRGHLASCPECRRRLAPYLQVDRSLHDAFKFLQGRVCAPSTRQIHEIVRESTRPEASVLLRRVRRPVNTMLWITVLVFSVGAGAVLAWLVYRVITLTMQ